MAELKAAVYVAEPVPIHGRSAIWSPISCTLIYSKREAVLADTPLTIEQTDKLIAWIEETAPNRRLSYIYITHGHFDHCGGIPLLIKNWPEALPIATAGTVKLVNNITSPEVFDKSYGAMFPNQIAKPFVLAKPLPADHQAFMLQDT